MNNKDTNSESEDNRLLEDERKWLIIISFKYFDLTQKDICEKFKFQKGTVSKIIQKYKQQNNVDNNFINSGRKSIQTEYPNIKEAIKDCLEEEPMLTLTQIKDELVKNHFDVSQTSVFNLMKEMHMVYKKTVLKHKLTDENKKTRLEYCKKWINRPFNNIWFSDESIFCIDKQNGYIWCEKSSDDHILYQKQQQYINRQIHVWGSISLDGRSDLYIHEKTVTSEEYIKCIEESLLPASKFYHYKRKIRLLQDGARSHTANKTKQYLEENGIEIIQNPAWSPDLNPIELIWGIMKKKWFKEKVKKTIEKRIDIIESVKDIWDNIPQYQIINSIQHIKQVMKVVIDKKGEYYE